MTVTQLCAKQYDDTPFLIESLLRDGNMLLCMWGNAGNVEISTDNSWSVAKETGVEFFCTPIFGFYNVASLAENINTNYKKELVFDRAIESFDLFRVAEEEGTYPEIIVPAEQRPIPMMYLTQTDWTLT